MTSPYTTKKQLKILRALTRLEYSLQADEKIEQGIAAMNALGAEGVVPQLETTLAEILRIEE